VGVGEEGCERNIEEALAGLGWFAARKDCNALDRTFWSPKVRLSSRRLT